MLLLAHLTLNVGGAQAAACYSECQRANYGHDHIRKIYQDRHGLALNHTCKSHYIIKTQFQYISIIFSCNGICNLVRRHLSILTYI